MAKFNQQSTGLHIGYRDPASGDVTFRINTDGTINFQSCTFGDGTTQTTAASGLPPITGGNTTGGVLINTTADWSGLLPPGNPGNLALWQWNKPTGDKDQYALFQSGTTVEARAYLGFLSKDGDYRWLLGKNAGAPEGNGDFGNFILYDATSGGHRMFCQSKFDGTGGPTYINSNGNFPVYINGGPPGLDLNAGTDGMQVQFGGGASPTTCMNVNGTTGVTTFSSTVTFTNTNNTSSGPVVINAALSNTVPWLTATPTGGGSVSLSLWGFSSPVMAGFGTDSNHDIQFQTNGTGHLRLKAGGNLWQASNSSHAFTSASNMTTADTGISRSAAGIVAIGTSDTVGDATGTLFCSTVKFNTALVTLGGGAAPTFGTIGGSGPATAAQNSWLLLKDSTGASFWVPAWK